MHAKYCRVVVTVPRRVDLSELFYQVAWQSLPPGAEIHPFDAAAIRRDAAMLRAFGRNLATVSGSCEPPGGRAASRKTECSLSAGQTVEVFRDGGPRAITAIRFTGRSKADLQGLWVEGIWDGVSQMRVPLHMLAGVSSAMEDTQSFPATVAGRQVMLRWFMPFAAEGRLLCTNAATRAYDVTAEVWTEPIGALQYPLRFHANFLTHRGIQTDGNTILTLADVMGSGRFVGCVLGNE